MPFWMNVAHSAQLQENRAQFAQLLHKFLDEIGVDQDFSDIIVSGELNPSYLGTIKTLGHKLTLVQSEYERESNALVNELGPIMKELKEVAATRLTQFFLNMIASVRPDSASLTELRNVLQEYGVAFQFLHE